MPTKRNGTAQQRAAIYLRQSQDRSGEQLGIDRQRDECHRLIEARGWAMVSEYVDNDVSATSHKPRPQFDAMMAAVDRGQVDVIVARHLDRLLRRLAELEHVLERCRAAGVAIVTAADSVDTSTDGGRLVARLLSSVAQGEVERKSARQRSQALQAAAAGRWVGGRRPFGYDADGVTVREDEAKLVRQGYADIFSGESLAEVARRWQAAGYITPQGREWTRASVRDVLINPRNAALRRHRPGEDRVAMRRDPEIGIVGAAQWPPLVDEPTWRAAARLIADPSKRRGPNRAVGLLTGVAVCAVCEGPVRRGAARAGIGAYKCADGHVARRSAPIDAYVEATIVEVLKRPDAADLWTPERPDAADLMAKADVLRRRLDDVEQDYLDGLTPRAKYHEQRRRIEGNLADIETKIAAAGQHSPLSIVASADADAAWAELSTAQKRTIIAALCVVVLHPSGQGARKFDPGTVTFRTQCKLSHIVEV